MTRSPSHVPRDPGPGGAVPRFLASASGGLSAGPAATLYGAAASGVTLPEALEATGIDGGRALLTAPSAYRVAVVDGRGCVTPAGPVDLSAVYEARIFTSEAELRWMEAGYAVLLTEDEHLLPPSFGEPVERLTALGTLEVRYLVWGGVVASSPGWTTLRSARVGTVTVPLEALPSRPGPRRGDRVRLVAREYVVADDTHGNAYVAEERLIGFEPYPASDVTFRPAERTP